MIVHLPNLNTILKRHNVHPKFWPEFRAYVEQGVLPGKELQTHLDYVANYRAAEKEVVKAIGCDHTFPPADYQSPLPYESLLAEDIVISPGVPSAAR